MFIIVSSLCPRLNASRNLYGRTTQFYYCILVSFATLKFYRHCPYERSVVTIVEVKLYHSACFFCREQDCLIQLASLGSFHLDVRRISFTRDGPIHKIESGFGILTFHCHSHFFKVFLRETVTWLNIQNKIA